ncbi:MAG: helix-turn-helix transcriptional regulator [Ruminococcaceae bacterium]|nr:helix-turn-helix transcriptional regulator [Oscillospiraceae bacterium]
MSIHTNIDWYVEINQVATGKRLREMRLAHHMTQQQLADVFTNARDFMSRRAIIRAETGRGLFSMPHFKFLAVLYGCTIDELIVANVFRIGEHGEPDQLVPAAYLLSYFFNAVLESVCVKGTCF